MELTKEAIDIVKLIETSNFSKLNKSYVNKFILKIQKTFSESQQQLFVGSFYTFLNYDPKKDFVIDFDDVWKWVGFSRKDNAKRVLDKHFTFEIDFKVEIPAPQVGGAGFEESKSPERNKGGAGLNKERVLLSVNTFKKFCMKANTKKADEIHDYYIKLEELLQETLNEESNELRLQVNQLKSDNKELSRFVKRKLTEKYKEGNCVYLISSTEHIDDTSSLKRFKVGITQNLNKRMSELNTGSAYHFQLIQAFYTDFNRLIESSVKELFAKYRASLSSEFYEIECLDEVQSFISGQIEYLEKFNKNKASVLKCEENKDDEVYTFDDNETVDSYIKNQKQCISCNEIKTLHNFFSKDKKNKIYHDFCIDCYKRDNGQDVKQCSTCEDIKKKIEFTVSRKRKDGLTSDCKECRYKRDKNYKEEHTKNNPNLGKLECPKCLIYKDVKNFFRNKIVDGKYEYIHPFCKECYNIDFGKSKQCFTCKKILNVHMFNITKANRDGLSCYCKECLLSKRKEETLEKEKLKDPNENKKLCLCCNQYLKYNMFFTKEESGRNILLDICMSCFEPKSLQCSKCKIIQVINNFSLDKTKRTGHRTICKECTKRK